MELKENDGEKRILTIQVGMGRPYDLSSQCAQVLNGMINHDIVGKIKENIGLRVENIYIINLRPLKHLIVYTIKNKLVSSVKVIAYQWLSSKLIIEIAT